VDPNGRIVAETQTLADEVVVADLDLDLCRQGKDRCSISPPIGGRSNTPSSRSVLASLNRPLSVRFSMMRPVTARAEGADMTRLSFSVGFAALLAVAIAQAAELPESIRQAAYCG